MASTSTQSMEAYILMRSLIPSHGVGNCAATRGPSMPAKTPNILRIKIVPIE